MYGNSISEDRKKTRLFITLINLWFFNMYEFIENQNIEKKEDLLKKTNILNKDIIENAIKRE